VDTKHLDDALRETLDARPALRAQQGKNVVSEARQEDCRHSAGRPGPDDGEALLCGMRSGSIVAGSAAQLTMPPKTGVTALPVFNASSDG